VLSIVKMVQKRRLSYFGHRVQIVRKVTYILRGIQENQIKKRPRKMDQQHRRRLLRDGTITDQNGQTC